MTDWQLGRYMPAILMSVPTFTAIYLYQSTVANLVAAVSFALVVFSSIDPARRQTYPSLRYLSIGPILVLFIFSRGIIGGFVLIFPYLTLGDSVILALSVFIWEIGLYYSQLQQTTLVMRNKLIDNGYVADEVESELMGLGKYFSRNLKLSLLVSVLAFAAIYVVPKVSAEILVLLIMFLVSYLVLSRYVIRDVPKF